MAQLPALAKAGSFVMRLRAPMVVVCLGVVLCGCIRGSERPASPPNIRPSAGLPANYTGNRPVALDPDDGISLTDPTVALYFTVDDIAEPGAYAYAGGEAVRIGIDDDAVDFTHPAFRGRIVLEDEGARFSYPRPLAGRLPDPEAFLPLDNAFDGCGVIEPCRIYVVDSERDPERIEGFARTVIEAHGFPSLNNRWFLFDRATQSWHELPALRLGHPHFGAWHGTAVASVAVGQAPEAVIVPLATNPDEQIEVLLARSVLLAAYADDPAEAANLESAYARERREWYASADIINSSYGTPVEWDSAEHEELLAGEASMRELLPLYWDAYTQRERPEAERTIQVFAAGNERSETGDRAVGFEAALPYFFDEFRGHRVAVTALNDDETMLADYANLCRWVPENWDAERFGPHYCLAAPGTHHGLAEPGGGSEPLPGRGTSFAAPYVAGVLARMKARFRHQVGTTEFVRRLMCTADRWEHGRCADLGPDELEVVSEAFRDAFTAEVDSWFRAQHEQRYRDAHWERFADEYTSENAARFEAEARATFPPRGADETPEEHQTRFDRSWMAAFQAAMEARFDAQAERAYLETALPAEVARQFPRYFGAGIVNPERGLNAVGARLTGTARNPHSAARSRLALPAAYGDAARRLEGIEIASFDAMNFPFWRPANAFVSAASRVIELIPDYAERRATSSCAASWGYTPGATCIPWSARDTVSTLLSLDGAGVGGRVSEHLTVAGYARSVGRLDGQTAGAFSFAGGSSLAMVRWARDWLLDDAKRWTFGGEATLALDTPWGIGRSRGSMFEAGTVLLSSWTLGLTRTDDDVRTRLSLSQPPRAEAGTGRLTYPSGRRLDGSWVYETRAFSLEPSRRERTLRLTHQRPLAGGDAVVSLLRTENLGHTSAPARHLLGFAWRRSF